VRCMTNIAGRWTCNTRRPSSNLHCTFPNPFVESRRSLLEALCQCMGLCMGAGCKSWSNSSTCSSRAFHVGLITTIDQSLAIVYLCKPLSISELTLSCTQQSICHNLFAARMCGACQEQHLCKF